MRRAAVRLHPACVERCITCRGGTKPSGARHTLVRREDLRPVPASLSLQLLFQPLRPRLVQSQAEVLPSDLSGLSAMPPLVTAMWPSKLPTATRVLTTP